MTKTEAELALRGHVVEMLAICNAANLKHVSVSVIPKGDEDDNDWWKVHILDGDDVVDVTCYYGDPDE